MDASTKLQEAAQAWKSGQDPEPFFEAAVEISADPPTLLAYSYYLHATQRSERAANLARRAAAMPQHRAQSHRVLGAILRDSDDLHGAITAYTSALEVEPEVEDALEIADLLIRTSFAQGAETWFVQAITLDPWNARAHCEYGIHLRLSGHAEQALQHLEKSSSIDPNFGLAWTELGATLIDVSRPSEALEALNRALKVDRKDFWALVYRANALWLTGDFKKAERDFKALIRLRPDDPFSHCWYAEFLAYQDDTRAEIEIEKALAISDDPAVLAFYNRIVGS